MNAVDILVLLQRLKKKTERGECPWQDTGNGLRLFLKTGSISFSYFFDEMIQGYDYTMKLYDTTEQFAYYHVDQGDDYREDLYQAFEKLKNAIENWKAEVINGKIKSLFDELA